MMICEMLDIEPFRAPTGTSMELRSIEQNDRVLEQIRCFERYNGICELGTGGDDGKVAIRYLVVAYP